ncbi:MAG: inositol monophosphatase family protein [Verrucomicrobiota bacterium]
MTVSEQRRGLAAAIEAAEAAGQLMARHRTRPKKVNASTQHDIKLDLDVRCQRVITRVLASAFPEIPVLGEEASASTSETADARWVVDPIDGTVNFAHDIPHAAVSIALQVRETPRSAGYADGYATVAGVVLDPFCKEQFTALRNGPARLNGRVIRVSRRPLSQAILSLGFSGRPGSVPAMVRDVRRLSSQVRKLRIMGSAALALAYVAAGRFDAYLERGIRLWDIAAGGLIVESAGGVFGRKEIGKDGLIALLASNGPAGRALQKHA